MTFLEKIRKALGLADEATEEQVLEALDGRVPVADLVAALELDKDTEADKLADAIKAKFAGEATEDDRKSLEERAREEGKVLLDATDYAQVKRDAERGKQAADELRQAKFDTAFDKALAEAKVDAKDETRERYQKLYDADPETTLEMLENLPKLAPTEARGSGKGASEAAPDNVDADRHALDRKVQAYMREHNESDYVKALDAVVAAEEASD